MAKAKAGSETYQPSSHHPAGLRGWYLLLFCAGFMLYANTIPHEYALDDAGAIENNLFVRDGLNGIPDLLKSDFWHFDNVQLGYYRPLSLITFAIEHEIVGANPHVSHFVNAFLYACSLLVLLLLLRVVFSKLHPVIPILISFLFAAHPVHTEVVANIKSRDELLSFLNLCAAIYFALLFAKWHRLWTLPVSAVFFYLAMLSRESAVTGLALLPLLLFYSLGLPGRRVSCFSAKYLLPYACFLLPAALFFIQKKFLLGTIGGNVPVDVINYPYVHADKTATLGMLFLEILRLSFFPLTLKYDYSFDALPAAVWSNPRAIAGLLLLVLFAIVAALVIRNRKGLNLGAALFLIALAPAIGFLFLRGGILAERFLFSPVVGICMILVFAFLNLTKKQDAPLSVLGFLKLNSGFTFVIAIIFLLFSVKTISRNAAWENNFSLFSTDIKNNLQSAQNHRHLGSEYINMATAEKDEAARRRYFNAGVAELRKAIAIHPAFGDAYFKIGVANHAVYLNTDSALKYYLLATEYAPGYAPAYNNLGIIYQDKKNYEMASYYYNKAVEVNPNFPDAKKHADALKAATGLDIRLMPVAIDLDSMEQSTQRKDHEFYYNLGTFYATKGDYRKAIEHLKKCIEMKPDYIDAYINLGNCYGILGMYQESIDACLKALQIDPYNRRALQNAAISYDKTGEAERAASMRARLEKVMTN